MGTILGGYSPNQTKTNKRSICRMPRGKLIVISGPSGCGKTTMAKATLARNPEIEFSVSATTRRQRNGEVEGSDYYFLSKEEFQEKIKNGELVEWEEIYGYYYGTLKGVVEKALMEGKFLLFDVDVKGGLSIKEKYPDDSFLIFIAPPSIEVAMKRLQDRGTDSEEDLRRRFERMPMEMEKEKSCDFTVVNDRLEQAIDEVDEIIRRETNRKHPTKTIPPKVGQGGTTTQ